MFAGIAVGHPERASIRFWPEAVLAERLVSGIRISIRVYLCCIKFELTVGAPLARGARPDLAEPGAHGAFQSAALQASLRRKLCK